MYHSISDDPEPGLSPYYKVCTSPQRFAEHMQWLSELGYRGVTLSEGLTWLHGQDTSETRHSASPEATPVAITFDDGFRDFHTAAFPALQRHGFTATMYLPTAFVGDHRRSFKSRECLTWAEVRELSAAGMEFGSHTVNHPRLVQLMWPAIRVELRDSRAEIEQRLGLAVSAFAYPYGFPQAEGKFVQQFQSLLQQAGYTSCATTTIGRVSTASDRMSLPRLPANSVDDRTFFTAKLAGAYDWLVTPQTASKQLSRWLRPTGRPVAMRS